MNQAGNQKPATECVPECELIHTSLYICKRMCSVHVCELASVCFSQAQFDSIFVRTAEFGSAVL